MPNCGLWLTVLDAKRTIHSIEMARGGRWRRKGDHPEVIEPRVSRWADGDGGIVEPGVVRESMIVTSSS
jgi:hypothetical protein